MNEDDILDAMNVKEAIKASFASVFSSLNLATEAWFQRTKLLTIGAERYADFVADTVGRFPLFGTGRTVSVETTYVRVNLSPDLERERYRSIAEIEQSLRDQRGGMAKNENRMQRALTPFQALEAGEGAFALLGHAGSGKTTIFRFITTQIAKGRPCCGRKRFALYIAARDLAVRETGIRDGCHDFLKQLQVDESERVLESLLASGTAVILLDGIDETSETHQKHLIRELTLLQSLYKYSLFGVSARPYSLSVGLPNFTKWETLPLAFDDRELFVQKWFAGVDAAKGERLLEQCRTRPELLDLGSSPLLLSITCALYHNDLEIPTESDELYSRAINGILGGWDAFRNIARKSILSALPIRRRMVLVSFLAATLFEHGKIVFSSEDVHKTGCLKQMADTLRCNQFEPDELLGSLYNDFGILSERSPGLYSFSHLTIHEFLVALHVVEQRKEIQLISRFRRSEEWREVFRLVAKLLPDAGLFMSALQSGIRLEVSSDVELLEAVWNVNPVCRADMRRKLVGELSKKLARAGRIARSFRCEGATLIVEVEKLPKTRMTMQTDLEDDHNPETTPGHSKRKSSKEQLVGPWLLIGNCLPSLLRVIRPCGFSFSELGVAENPLFQALAASDFPDIQTVRFEQTMGDPAWDTMDSEHSYKRKRWERERSEGDSE